MVDKKSEKEILDHLSNYGIKGKEGRSVWAIPTSRLAGYKLIKLTYGFRVLNISDTQISIIRINELTGNIIKSVPDIIYMNMISNITLKKGILYNKLIITTAEGKFKYKVLKRIWGKGWQKENVGNLLSKYPKIK